MKTWGIALIVAGVTAVVLLTSASAQTSTQIVHVPVVPFTLQLGAPSTPARITAGDALKAAEVAWGPALFTGHPHTVRYGSYRSNLVHRSAAGPSPIGSQDVCAITVSGLNIPRPAAEIAQADGAFKVVAPPNIHTDIILIDDKTGKYLEGIGG